MKLSIIENSYIQDKVRLWESHLPAHGLKNSEMLESKRRKMVPYRHQLFFLNSAVSKTF